MNIYEIKEYTKDTAPFFFSDNTLKFFGQTMKKWKVEAQPDGRYKISQPIKDRLDNFKKVGMTIYYFNPLTNELEKD